MQSAVNVFVSAAWSDSRQPERQAVDIALKRFGESAVIGVQVLGGGDDKARALVFDTLDQADVYVGIFGTQYGSGIAEAEYWHARERGISCLIFASDIGEGSAGESDEDGARLAALKAKLRQSHPVFDYSTTDDLAARVEAELSRWMLDRHVARQRGQAEEAELPYESVDQMLGKTGSVRALNEEPHSRPSTARNVSAIGDRSVAIGGSVIGSPIITGDNNTVFVGTYEHLADVYISPQTIFDRVDVEHFVGRDWMISEIDRFLHEAEEGYFILEGAAGTGKTSLLAHLVRTRGYINHFVDLAPGVDGIAPALKNLAAQLIRTWELQPTAANEVLPGLAARPEFLHAQLSAAAAARNRLRPDKKIVLVIDGLDEAGTPGQGAPGLRPNVLGLPRLLPKGVYIIASQRPGTDPLNIDAIKVSGRLEADEDNNLRDMQVFLRAALERLYRGRSGGAPGGPDKNLPTGDALVNLLIEKSRGNWIYLHYLLGDLERGEPANIDVRAMPRGIWQYYARYWRTWRDRDRAAWVAIGLVALGTLAAVQEPISIIQLSALTGIPDKSVLERLLAEAWRPFLAVDESGQGRRYRLYHASLREFLDGRIPDGQLTEADEVLARELSQATIQSHGRIADRYLSAWGGIAQGLSGLQTAAGRDLDNGYGTRHLAAHLLASGRFNELRQVLRLEWGGHHAATAEGPRWRRLVERLTGHAPADTHSPVENAWFAVHEQAGDIASYLTSLMHAWRSAEEQSMASVAAHNLAPSIGLEIRYALLTSAVTGLAENTPEELLIGLLQKGVLTEAEVLALPLAIRDGRERGIALATLVPHLSGPIRDRALAEAVAQARRLDDAEDKVLIYQDLAPFLTRSALEDAVALVRGEDRETDRIEPLTRFVPYLEDGLKRDVSREILSLLRQFDDTEERVDTLVALAPHVPDDFLREMLTMARTSESVTGRIVAIHAVIPRLAEPARGQVLAEVASLVRRVEEDLKEEDLETAKLHLSAFPLLPAEQRTLITRKVWELTAPKLSHRILRMIVALKRRFDDDGDDDSGDEAEYIEIIAWLLPHLPEQDRPEAVRRAVALLQKMDDEEQRAEALARFASYIPGPQRARLLANAHLQAVAIRNTERRASTLALLVPHLSEAQLRDAVRVAREVRDDDALTWARLVLQARDAGSAPGRSDAEAFAAAKAAYKRDERVEVLTRLSPYLRGSLLREALDVARSMPASAGREKLLVSLAPYLPTDLIPTCFAIARRTEYWYDLAVVMSALAPWLTDELLAEALQHLPDRFYPAERAWMLAAYIPYLPAGERGGRLEEVLSLSGEMRARWIQQRVDKRLAKKEPEQFRPRVRFPVRIRSRARFYAKDDEVRREDLALALADLAPHLRKTQRRRIVEETLALTRTLARQASRAEILADLTPSLSLPQLRQVVASTRRLQDDASRAEVLVHLATWQPSRYLRSVRSPRGHQRFTRTLPPHARRSSPRATTAATVHPWKTATRPGTHDLLMQDAAVLARAVRAAHSQHRPARHSQVVAALRRLLHAVRDDRTHGHILAKLAPCLPTSLLADAGNLILAVRDKDARTAALTALTGRLIALPRDQAYLIWRNLLAGLSQRSRMDLLHDISALAPFVNALGAEEALAEARLALADVGRWWP